VSRQQRDALDQLLRDAPLDLGGDVAEQRVIFEEMMAAILDAAKGEATAERLLNCGLYDPQRKIPDVKKWLAAEAYADDHHHHHDVNRHDEHIGSFVLTADAALPRPRHTPPARLRRARRSALRPALGRDQSRTSYAESGAWHARSGKCANGTD